jgi:hypothetical protein
MSEYPEKSIARDVYADDARDPENENRLPVAVDTCFNQVDEMAEVISNLTSILDSYMSHPEPSAPDDSVKAVAVDVSSQAVRRMRDLRACIKREQRRLQDIVHRLET